MGPGEGETAPACKADLCCSTAAHRQIQGALSQGSPGTRFTRHIAGLPGVLGVSEARVAVLAHILAAYNALHVKQGRN